MPVYKPKVEYFVQALDALFAQTEKNWECIIHNQPWDFDLVGALAKYLADPRVTFIQSDVTRTIGENWNACLEHAASPYLAYLFYDDLWEPTYLETLCEILDKHPSVGFVSANRSYLFMGDSPQEVIYDEVSKALKQLPPGEHVGQSFLMEWIERNLRPNIIGEPSFVMLRRSLVDKVGTFHSTMAQFLDAEYWVRCLIYGNWYFEPTTLGRFRVHMAGTSAQNSASGKGSYERLEAMEHALRLLPSEQRHRLNAALRRTCTEMIGKYLGQRKKIMAGTKTFGNGGGSFSIVKFIIRHPIITACSILGIFFARKKPAA